MLLAAVHTRDLKRGAFTPGTLTDELKMLPEDVRQQCQEVLEGESIEWHREHHLKRAVLEYIVSKASARSFDSVWS